jgi:hypothetical protein
METLGRAAERLTELVADTVIPLEQEISKVATKYFPRFQNDYGSLSEKLVGLGLGGSERIITLNQDLADVLFTDASDAPQRLGAENSAIYDNLRWAIEVKRELDNGLDMTVRSLQAHLQEIDSLPNTGAPGELRNELSEDLLNLSERLKTEDFFKYAADLNSLLTHIKGRVRDTVLSMSEQQKLRLKDGVEDFQRLSEWSGLTQEDRGNAVAQLEALALTVPEDLSGLKRLLARDFDISSTIDKVKKSIARQDQERRRMELEAEVGQSGVRDRTMLSRSIPVPSKVASATELDTLIQALNELKTQLALYDDIDISFVLGGDA